MTAASVFCTREPSGSDFLMRWSDGCQSLTALLAVRQPGGMVAIMFSMRSSKQLLIWQFKKVRVHHIHLWFNEIFLKERKDQNRLVTLRAWKSTQTVDVYSLMTFSSVRRMTESAVEHLTTFQSYFSICEAHYWPLCFLIPVMGPTVQLKKGYTPKPAGITHRTFTWYQNFLLSRYIGIHHLFISHFFLYMYVE